MPKKEVVETVYGKYSKFEVIKSSDVFSTSFYVYKDGKYYKGSYSSLRAAVEAANEAAKH
jgi:hypothetical protein